jgi:hypothetical protein
MSNKMQDLLFGLLILFSAVCVWYTLVELFGEPKGP